MDYYFIITAPVFDFKAVIACLYSSIVFYRIAYFLLRIKENEFGSTFFFFVPFGNIKTGLADFIITETEDGTPVLYVVY